MTEKEKRHQKIKKKEGKRYHANNKKDMYVGSAGKGVLKIMQQSLAQESRN